MRRRPTQAEIRGALELFKPPERSMQHLVLTLGGGEFLRGALEAVQLIDSAAQSHAERLPSGNVELTIAFTRPILEHELRSAGLWLDPVAVMS